jgi:beta-glucosidase
MSEATFHFPKGFLWGTATAAHQVEGNNTNNNWWAWEQQAGHIANEQRSGLACDWWHGRWREDFDRAAAGGQNAHRFSVEWSRIQPAPQRWDEAALDRYREMLRGLRERGLSPLVTLHHFTDPLWIEAQGGWENEAIVGNFASYVRKTVEAFQDYCDSWVTINEPNVLAAMAYLAGLWPPGRKDPMAMIKALTNIVRAHAAAYREIHALQPSAQVGMAIMIRKFTPSRRWNPLDRLSTWLFRVVFDEFFPIAISTGRLHFPGWSRRLPEARETQDFFGLNYYTTDCVAFSPLNPTELVFRRHFLPGADLSDCDYIANTPQGMFEALRWALRFNVPIMITENGVENADDGLRPRYLIQHLHQVWRAVNFNYPVRGYFHWTLVDNFEWERGWQQRFGLWELDPETQARRKRPSADLYAEICRENGLSSDMVRRYAPEILEQMFPG